MCEQSILAQSEACGHHDQRDSCKDRPEELNAADRRVLPRVARDPPPQTRNNGRGERQTRAHGGNFSQVLIERRRAPARRRSPEQVAKDHRRTIERPLDIYQINNGLLWIQRAIDAIKARKTAPYANPGVPAQPPLVLRFINALTCRRQGRSPCLTTTLSLVATALLPICSHELPVVHGSR
jgi:hypothetical protein